MFVFLFLNFPYIINVHTSFKLNIFYFIWYIFGFYVFRVFQLVWTLIPWILGKSASYIVVLTQKKKYICHTWVVLPTFCHCQNAQTVLKYDKWIFSDIKLLKIFFFYSFYSFQATNQNCVLFPMLNVSFLDIFIYICNSDLGSMTEYQQ